MTQIQTKQSILKLIKEAEAQFSGTGKSLLDIEDYVAEYLTANGVIVPILRIGQKVWLLARIYYSKKKTGGIEVAECVISSFRVNQLNKFFTAHYKDNEISIHPSEIGISVFLTRDDAEKALAERGKE